MQGFYELAAYLILYW